MSFWSTMLNITVFIVLTVLTGNLIFGMIGAYGFHKGRMSMKKKYDKTDDNEDMS